MEKIIYEKHLNQKYSTIGADNIFIQERFAIGKG